ncbi:MAG: co-chaperone GroES [Thermotogota bacterium]|nr:co-chaperone GroES [Thermotogota bacterium]
MQLQPLGTRVLVKRKPEVTKTAGGIFIPDTCTEKPMEGDILSIGDEVKKVKPGEKVLFAKFAGVEVVSNDVGMFLIMDENELLGIII